MPRRRSGCDDNRAWKQMRADHSPVDRESYRTMAIPVHPCTAGPLRLPPITATTRSPGNASRHQVPAVGTTHAIAAAERFWRGTGYNTQPVDDERSRVLVAAQRTLDRYAFDNAHRAMRSRYGLMVELLPDAAGVIRQSSRVRGRNPKAHALAHPRITGRVHDRRKARYRLGRLTQRPGGVRTRWMTYRILRNYRILGRSRPALPGRTVCPGRPPCLRGNSGTCRRRTPNIRRRPPGAGSSLRGGTNPGAKL